MELGVDRYRLLVLSSKFLVTATYSLIEQKIAIARLRKSENMKIWTYISLCGNEIAKMILRKRDLRKFEQTFELRKRDCELPPCRLRLFESKLRSAWPGFQYLNSHILLSKKVSRKARQYCPGTDKRLISQFPRYPRFPNNPPKIEILLHKWTP